MYLSCFYQISRLLEPPKKLEFWGRICLNPWPPRDLVQIYRRPQVVWNPKPVPPRKVGVTFKSLNSGNLLWRWMLRYFFSYQMVGYLETKNICFTYSLGTNTWSIKEVLPRPPCAAICFRWAPGSKICNVGGGLFQWDCPYHACLTKTGGKGVNIYI